MIKNMNISLIMLHFNTKFVIAKYFRINKNCQLQVYFNTKFVIAKLVAQIKLIF